MVGCVVGYIGVEQDDPQSAPTPREEAEGRQQCVYPSVAALCLCAIHGLIARPRHHFPRIPTALTLVTSELLSIPDLGTLF
jgi:hypothetical protein